MSEDAIASVQDDVAELQEEMRAVHLMLQELHTIVTAVGDFVRPGYAEHVKERLAFIVEAHREIDEMDDGAA